MFFLFVPFVFSFCFGSIAVVVFVFVFLFLCVAVFLFKDKGSICFFGKCLGDFWSMSLAKRPCI